MATARHLATGHLGVRIAELAEQGTPFVHAIVVRAQCPTSARPGDAAIVLPDGSIEGFVGGQCAETSVREAALAVLDDGEALLLRILPAGDVEFPETPGARTVVNPCLSGGAIEVFLDPKRPAPRLVVVGNTPIAHAVVAFAQTLGYDVAHVAEGTPDARGALAVLVATHGRDEPESVRAALEADVGFVGLVASEQRGSAVVAALQLSGEERARVHTPVGIAIGARTAEEIALSVLGEIVRAVRIDGLRAPEAAAQDRPATAVDPVCGMTVVVDAATPHLVVDGVDHWFCNPGCRTRFAEDMHAQPSARPR